MDNDQLIDNAKYTFLKMIDDFQSDPWNLKIHLREAEKWAKIALSLYPEIDSEVVMLSLWLHDIGHYPIPDEDHAVVSEKIAIQFFKEKNTNPDLTRKVLHCIRSHRNSDVKPSTPEAKLFVMIDSVSHFTYCPYIEMAIDGRGKQAMEKLERDFRDIQDYPKIKNEIEPLYKATKKLLIELHKAPTGE